MQQNNGPLGQIPQAQQPNVEVSAQEFAAKFKSKRECYSFLAGDCNVSLPPYGKWSTPLRLTFSTLQTT